MKQIVHIYEEIFNKDKAKGNARMYKKKKEETKNKLEYKVCR